MQKLQQQLQQSNQMNNEKNQPQAENWLDGFSRLDMVLPDVCTIIM